MTAAICFVRLLHFPLEGRGSGRTGRSLLPGSDGGHGSGPRPPRRDDSDSGIIFQKRLPPFLPCRLKRISSAQNARYLSSRQPSSRLSGSMNRETAMEKGEWICRSAFASMITRYNSALHLSATGCLRQTLQWIFPFLKHGH